MKDSIHKELSEYKVLVFDLDGTLYFQKKLRIKMALMLLSYYVLHPLRVKELFIIKRFREIRENWDILYPANKNDDFEIYVNKLRELIPDEDSELDLLQYAYTAKEMNSTYEMIRNTIRTWMYEKPLKAVYETRDKSLIYTIECFRKRGQKVVILSDYPVEDKLNALRLPVDGMYSATDERIQELKPGKKGLEVIMEDYGLNNDELIMIGDRMSKDGEAAKNAGCDYIILGKNVKSRKAANIYL